MFGDRNRSKTNVKPICLAPGTNFIIYVDNLIWSGLAASGENPNTWNVYYVELAISVPNATKASAHA
jgi:hypothetical protein